MEYWKENDCSAANRLRGKIWDTWRDNIACCLLSQMSTCELALHVAIIYYLSPSSPNQWVMWYPLSLCSVLTLTVTLHYKTLTLLLYSLSFSFCLLQTGVNIATMDAESEKRASTSTLVSRFSSFESMDRLVDTEEMEAAETLAQLAMRDSHSTDKWCTKLCAIPELHLSPTLHSDPSLGIVVRFLSLFFPNLIT